MQQVWNEINLDAQYVKREENSEFIRCDGVRSPDIDDANCALANDEHANENPPVDQDIEVVKVETQGECSVTKTDINQKIDSFMDSFREDLHRNEVICCEGAQSELNLLKKRSDDNASTAAKTLIVDTNQTLGQEDRNASKTGEGNEEATQADPEDDCETFKFEFSYPSAEYFKLLSVMTMVKKPQIEFKCTTCEAVFSQLLKFKAHLNDVSSIQS